MSIRYTITDPEDVEISEDGKELEVLYDSDDQGNWYVDVPIDIVLKRLPDPKAQIIEIIEGKIQETHTGYIKDAPKHNLKKMHQRVILESLLTKIGEIK